MLKSLAFGIATCLLAIYLTFSWVYADVVFSVDTDKKIVALSFDDGPNPGETEALLDVLNELDVRASFFLKGMNVEAHPEIAMRIHREGHEIGNHSWTHRRLVSFSKTDMLEELQLTNKTIERAIGIRPTLFRPPFILQGLGLKRAVSELDMLSVAGNIAANDWEDQDPDLLASRVLDQIQPGSIIVLHDGEGDIYDGSEQGNRFGTVAATKLMVERLIAQGYTLTTAGKLLELHATSSN